ncbi:glycoside hydrolase family 3 N-terminal domain-containing protein [Nocardioides acrostichi]|uniref:beta-N-acetylhexosaminidase n=1 Tax=Nocardioides acrostichi TaxID=2784339 RepID=A0A930UYW7_9ACTN|nr:glycoside hydrolase family 3 N-terminal domain-containing protein [Nocardioides acrostichi]MBF4160934.1 glycosyl hyrolase family 3 [Nocardioides acrostichi]
MRRLGLAAAAVVAAGALAGCASDGPARPTARESASGPPSTSVTPSTTSTPTTTQGPAQDPTQEPTQDLGEPLPWGPTVGELAQAHEIVAAMTAGELAGQVIVGRYAGTDPSVAARLVRRLHLAGVCVTNDNVVDADQVRATTRAVTRAAHHDGRDFPAVIGIDEEGGTVSHLRGIATDFPAFEDAGLAIGQHERRGRQVVQQAAYATAQELRAFGFSWVFAPDADVTIGPADVTIGSRSPSSDPKLAALAVGAAVRGYDDAGLVSTIKHFPGHGSATVDSHRTLPHIDASMRRLEHRDLRPFARGIDAGAPAVMVGHLDVEAMAPGGPSSVEPKIYDYLRDDLGFEGVAITDSLGMGAVAGIPDLGVKALEAGADLLLMPADTTTMHRVVKRAVEDGTLSRDRVEDAAARVVALQLWQASASQDDPLPADPAKVAENAEAASAALREAAYGS